MDYTLYHGDCLEEMARIDAGSVDAIIADLPYGTTACKWDSVIPLEPLWAHFKRVLKPRGAVVLFGAQPFTSTLVQSNLEWFRYEWVWDKALPNGMLNAKIMPLRRHEHVLIFSENGVPSTYNPQMEPREAPRINKGNGQVYGDNGKSPYGKRIVTSGVYTHRYPVTIQRFSNANQAAKVHPTQKPTDLLEYLVRTYTNEGETVLDCTAGSGTTGVACMNTGRNFIGIELEREYYDIAAQRIEKAANAARQLELL